MNRHARKIGHLAGLWLVLAALSAAALGAAALGAESRSVKSGLAPEEFKSKADKAFTALAAYDLGAATGVLTEIEDLVRATHGNAAQRSELAARCAAVLQSGAPYGAKDFACRQLAFMGTREQVPVLAALLTDEKLSTMARFALESIPDPAAADALLASLGKVQGKTLLGVIHSLGARREARAAKPLGALASDANPAVATAVANALGNLGTPAALAILGDTLEKAPASVRPVVAHNCLRCAEAVRTARVAGESEAELARRLAQAEAAYRRVLKADVPTTARRAALHSLITLHPAVDLPLLVEQIKASDQGDFSLALFILREVKGEPITRAAASELANLPPQRQSLLIEALADRGDRAALPAILALAQRGPAEGRPTAIRALGALGDASVMPVLLEIATGSAGPLSQAAESSLASVPAKDADAALLATLASPEAKLRRAAIDALGRRNAATAVPALLKAARDSDASVRVAAVKALGSTAGLANLDSLAELAVQTAPQELAGVEKAVVSACATIADKNACAQKLLARYPAADAAHKALLLRVLGQVGGAEALGAVRAALRDSNAELRDAAVRALCGAATPETADDLLRLAREASESKHKILALQAALRLASQDSVAAQKRLAICKEAIALADREEEKKMALGTLGGIPSAEALALVVPYVDQAPMKGEACAAAVAVAEKIVRRQPGAVAAAMRKVLDAAEDPALKKKAKDLLDQAGSKGK